MDGVASAYWSAPEKMCMPTKLLRTETDDRLTIERVMYVRRYSLSLDRTRCVGCEICSITCPREAIEVKVPPKVEGEKRKPPRININVEKCNYCGICNAICPFGALELRINGERVIPVVNSESFPKLIREVEVEPEKCPPGCRECEEACPFNLIEVIVRTPDGEKVEDVNSYPDKGELRVEVNLDKAHCPCCMICEVKCPEDAIHIKKIFHGYININGELCPEGCRDCLDVCPIPDALYISEDGKVEVNETFCIYCGACKLTCPVEGALTLQRTLIRHTPVHSGAWNKALEKLTSTRDVTKELRSKAILRARSSVEKRLGWRVA